MLRPSGREYPVGLVMPGVLPNFLHDVQATLLLAAPLVAAAAVVGYLVSRRVGVERGDAAVRAAAVGALAVHLLAVVTATRLVEVIVGGGDDYAAAQIELVPLAGIASYLRWGVSATALVQIVGNVALLFPIGVLVPLVVGRDPGWRTLLAVGIAGSVAIEVVQWRFALGVASVDDVLLNVTGVVLGYLVYRGLIGRRATPGKRVSRFAARL
jgi:glycopeptide antibiotics resistance protein